MNTVIIDIQQSSSNSQIVEKIVVHDLEANITFRDPSDKVLSLLKELYGANLERVWIIVEDIHRHINLLTPLNIKPPYLLDIRWLGRAIYGVRPGESLSELHVRCGGMPLLPEGSISPEEYSVQKVKAMSRISSHIFSMITHTELSAISNTAWMYMNRCLVVGEDSLRSQAGEHPSKGAPNYINWSRRVINETDNAGHLSASLDYSKAVTGRFAAAPGCPFHSIPKLPDPNSAGYQVVCDILSSVSTPDGLYFMASDAKAIEPRIMSYLSGDTVLSQEFVDEADIYTQLVSQALPEQSAQENMRSVGKQAFLGFCYGIGAEKLRENIRKNTGRNIECDDCQQLLNQLKSKYRIIVAFARDLEQMLRSAYTEDSASCGMFIAEKHEDHMSIKLPSGRYIRYYGFQIDESGKLTYTASDGKVKTLYSAKIMQNIVQAVARDILVEVCSSVMQAGIFIVYHVHDDIVCITADPNIDIAQYWKTPIPWLPGLILDADQRKGRTLFDLTK